MTPGARVQAAIECLDRVVAGAPAEQVLLRWSRGARHAGSKDRAAVRDHVFDALRRWWSCAARGGGQGGRARMIGLLRSDRLDPSEYFTGTGYDPAPLAPGEGVPHGAPAPLTDLDCPEWLAPELRSSLGGEFAAVMSRLRTRAPVFLRVNVARTDRDGAIADLAHAGVTARAHPLSPTALEVIENPRKVAASAAYRSGLVEIQDAASQAVVDAIPLDGVARVLDYCAGGGGKALAIAARTDARIDAHDAAPERMRDIPVRAARAGARIDVIGAAAAGRAAYDLVVVDAPCSGSGAWRRSPEGKIRLDRPGLDRLASLQSDILSRAAAHVAPGGRLAYVTCSLLDVENAGRTAAFLRRAPEFRLDRARSWTPLDGGDGFHLSLIARSSTRG